MWAVDGMSSSTSLIELAGQPPIFFATLLAISLAIGMYDWLRFSPAFGFLESRTRAHGQYHRRRRTSSRELSVTCITSSRIVRRAQPKGTSDRAKSAGRVTQAAMKRSGRGTRPPPSVSGLASRPMRSEPRG